MFKKAQILITLLALLVMANGCGEGFRGQKAFKSEEASNEFFDEGGNRRNLSTPDNDRFILQSYANELNGTEESTRHLTSRIQAFDMIMEGQGDGDLTLEARLMISCDETYSFKREIEVAELRSLQVQRLGRQGDYEVEVRCSQRNCQEMIAAVRKYQGRNRGTLLVGLGIGGQGGAQVLFVSRQVRYSPYFAAFPNTIDYGELNSCEFESPDDKPDSIEEYLTDIAVEAGQKFLQNIVGEITEGITGSLEDIF